MALATFYDNVLSRSEQAFPSVCLLQIRCGHIHIDVGWQTLPCLMKRCIMNNRSHVGMKPVLSLYKSSGLMACCTLTCDFFESIYFKKETLRLRGALILQMDVRRGTFFFGPYVHLHCSNLFGKGYWAELMAGEGD